MSMSAKFRRAPLRIATGAYILNSGVSKVTADDDTAKTLHGAASGTYSFVGNMQPKAFARSLGMGEIAVGAAVLLPVVSPVVAGAALVALSGALLNMYWQTPGMHREGSPLPTTQGMPFAKDVWMFGMGLGLIADATLEPAHDKVVELETAVSRRRSARGRRSRRTAQKAKAAGETARQWAEQYGPVAAKKAKAAGETARHWAEENGPVVAEKARAARDATIQAAGEYATLARDRVTG